MIEVKCQTNLDDFKGLQWPTKLQIVPSIGHRVESCGGFSLKIVGITHTYTGLILIDLHK